MVQIDANTEASHSDERDTRMRKPLGVYPVLMATACDSFLSVIDIFKLRS